ncbi:MAG: response regulator [Gammaproteobacteria bacterium]|nr:response regulator [Gammaproteobacteria bacterium]
MRLLLIEDDQILGNGIQAGLSDSAVDWFENAESGEHALRVENYDALILDLTLPGKGGLVLLRELRANGNDIPVLILTARDSVSDRVAGLDSGADDYLIKPFALDELNARLRALIRRRGGRAAPCLRHGDLELDPAAHSTTLAGLPITLSAKEFRILQSLLENKGRVLSRTRLEESLYSWDDGVESNAVEVHIHHLRKKLGKKLIKTLRGVGYVVEKQTS